MFGPKSPAYSIGRGSRLKKSISENPGPGTYEIPIEKSKRLSFSKSPKAAKFITINPGPGDYVLNSSIGTGPKAIIISRRLRRSIEIYPGPSDYFPKLEEKTVKYTFKKERNRNSVEINPGPGAYSPNPITQKSPSAVIGKAKRSQSNAIIFPGPGSYNPEGSPTSKDCTFAKSSRDTSPKKLGPGPGDYFCQPLLDSKTSAIIIPRRSFAAKHNTPGPGAYNNLNVTSNTPKWTISKAAKQNVFSITTPNASPRAVYDKNNVYSGSTEISSPEKQDNSPNKRAKRHNSEKKCYFRPGPADYYPKAMQTKNPSAVFGTSKRTRNKPQCAPGPADYNTRKSPDAKGFSFTKEKKIKFVRFGGPGPGDYEIPNTIGSVT